MLCGRKKGEFFYRIKLLPTSLLTLQKNTMVSSSVVQLTLSETTRKLRLLMSEVGITNSLFDYIIRFSTKSAGNQK